MRYRPPRRRGWMLRIRLPYGDVVSSSRSRGNAKHQIYMKASVSPLFRDRTRSARYATSRATNRTRVRSGPGSTGCSAAVERGRSRSRRREQKTKSTIRTRPLIPRYAAARQRPPDGCLPQPRARARRSHQATLYEECVLLPRSPLWHRALKVKHLAPHVGAVPRKLRRPPQLQQVLPLALGGRGIGELPAVEAP